MRRTSGKLLRVLLFVLGWVGLAAAADSFVIEDIRLEGLQRISVGTVFNYLPIKVGDTISESDTAGAIRALFKTGFFKDVRIERDRDTLVISVVERPSIAEINFSGNSDVKTDELLESLKQVGFATGRVFNRSVFEQVEQELRRTYFGLGKYGVKIESTVTPLERNRVAVDFEISEGRVAKIRQINIVGNKVFDDEELVDLYNLSEQGWFTFLTRSDQYSRQKLSADLETMQSYYLDRGYINFNIDSTQVSITPDKQFVYITVNVTEGANYTIREIKLAGELKAPQEDLFRLVKVRPGQVFSRRAVTETSQSLGERLGQEGYAFANVNAVPDIDEENKTVSLTFFVDPGKRVYVRRINFKGNTKTRDEVLRREMRQLEGGWISTSAVERSRIRLQRLGFFEDVNVETPAVPGTTDQVDVNFSVVERPSGNFIAGIGFSQSQGIVLNTSITQENFLGSGNRVSFAFNNSSVNRVFSVGYFDPYYTIDGVSRGINAYYRETDADNANVSDYTTDELAGNVNWGIPLTEFDRLTLGVGAERTKFKLGDDPSDEVRAFRDENGKNLDSALFNAAIARDTRNSSLFPDRGSLQRLSSEVTVPGSDLQYYKLSYDYEKFIPLGRGYTLKFDANLGYGDGYGKTNDLPIIDNFFAGGIRSVRGFKANTLGPRDSEDDPLGGDLKTVGSTAIILPVPFVEQSKSVRLTVFVDGGNVFGPGPSGGFGFDEFRYSAGGSAVWLSPIGALTFSLSQPLNDRSGDDTQPFQFTFGTSF